MGGVTKNIGVTLMTIVATLVVGEMFGNVVSKSITAWKRKGMNVENIVMMFDAMNQRICNLEEKKEIEA